MITPVPHELRKYTTSRTIWVVAFLVGLAIRIASLRFYGTLDLATYSDWGHKVSELGLARAYSGIYFPIEYELFSLSLKLAHVLGGSDVLGLKLMTLIFDLGTFLVLRSVLRAVGVDSRWALVYWLNPYFVELAWLGYVDAQVAFFVILAVYVMVRYSSWRYVLLVAGLPLGVAFSMKPQVETIILVSAMVVVARFAADSRTGVRGALARLVRGVQLFIGPALCFGALTLYFYRAGFPITWLAHSYSPQVLAQAMNSLTANMPNIWYLPAYLQVKAHQPIYTVTGPPVLHIVGTIITVVLLAAIAVFVALQGRMSDAWSLIVAWAAAEMIQPMTITRAHENHFFLGAVLGLVLFKAIHADVARRILVALLWLQAVHLFLHYGLGLNGISRSRVLAAVVRTYNTHLALQTSVAMAATAIFALLCVAAGRAAGRSSLAQARGRSLAPSGSPGGRSATTSI